MANINVAAGMLPVAGDLRSFHAQLMVEALSKRL